jgi:hypothetical protein
MFGDGGLSLGFLSHFLLLACQLTCKRLNYSSLRFLLSSLQAFQNYKKLMQVKLRMTAEEERAEKEHLEQLQQQEKQDHARFVALHDKLALDRSEHREILLQKDIKVRHARRTWRALVGHSVGSLLYCSVRVALS